MPRYYCDYCDTYLTHDSPSVRKQHNAGYKHKANVRAYYQQFEEQQTQSLIDQKVREHLGQTAAVYQQAQMGGAFHPHLAAIGQFKPPITLPVLPIPVAGANASVVGSTTVPSIRPPVLSVPAIPAAVPSTVGYPSTPGAPQFRVPPPPPGPPGISAPPPGQQTAGSTMMQPNGLPRPPAPPPSGASSAPGAPGVPGVPVARTPSLGSSGPTAAYINTSLQPSSGYRSQSYNAPPGTTSSYPQQQAGPPSAPSSQHSQQRGVPQTTGSQSSYGYGPPSQGPYAAPPGSSVSYRN